MPRYRLSLTLALATTLVAGAARAETAIAVLGIEPGDAPESLAQSLTDALRQRASSTPGLKLAPGKDLVELKMVFGCDGESPSCMAQAGRSLGVDKLLYGRIKKAGARSPNLQLTLKLLDVSSATVEKSISETIPRKELVAGTVNAPAAKWFGTLVQIESRPPSLTVTSDPPGAVVAVDGQAMGRTPVTLRDLSPGGHSVAVALTGHVTASRTVELRPGGSHEVNVTLESEPAPPSPPPLTQTAPPALTPPPLVQASPPPPAHPGRTAKILGLVAGGAALVSGAVAIYTWRTYRDLEDSAHSELLQLSKQAAPTDANFFKSPTCTPPASVAGSALAQRFKDDCSSGESFASATTALWVVAGVLAAGGVVSYVVGDRQAAHAREVGPKSTARLLRQSLRIEPVVTTKSGGLQAAFEF
jgi:hypothetical protein